MTALALGLDQQTMSYITLIIAVVGAVLGIINTWRAIARDRVRVRVLVEDYLTSDLHNGIAITAVNLGHLPVTISSMGFLLRKKKHLVFPPGMLDQLKFPHRLEPRASVTYVLPSIASHHPSLGAVRCAVVKTQCMRHFHGTSRSLKRRVRKARKLAAARRRTREERYKALQEARNADHDAKVNTRK